MRSVHTQGPGPIVLESEATPTYVKMPAEQFADHLHRVISALRRRPCYAVGLYNDAYWTPAYFGAPRAHNVAHVFNSWARMPLIGEKLEKHDSLTADFIVSRVLLKSGRIYNEAVDACSPHD